MTSPWTIRRGDSFVVQMVGVIPSYARWSVLVGPLVRLPIQVKIEMGYLGTTLPALLD